MLAAPSSAASVASSASHSDNKRGSSVVVEAGDSLDALSANAARTRVVVAGKTGLSSFENRPEIDEDYLCIKNGQNLTSQKCFKTYQNLIVSKRKPSERLIYKGRKRGRKLHLKSK
jgi:hypothetical protein